MINAVEFSMWIQKQGWDGYQDVIDEIQRLTDDKKNAAERLLLSAAYDSHDNLQAVAKEVAAQLLQGNPDA